MLEKIFHIKLNIATDLLKKINVHSERAHCLTEVQDISRMLRKPTVNVPPIKFFLKAMKKQEFSVDYLLKCSAVVHFFLQQTPEIDLEQISDFFSFLMVQCNGLGRKLDCLWQPKIKNTLKTTFSTQPDEMQGKEIFILKEIARPYLCYLTKKVSIKQQSNQSRILESYQAWRQVNLLKMISGFTYNFMTIGRYYKMDYGAIIILLTEILSADICSSVERINQYIRRQYKMLCLRSEKEQQKREVEDFIKLLQQLGNLNEKFTQLFLGKYFYQYLQHIQHPQWLDNNSPQFDNIFKNRQQKPL